jgi:hypothetical protein
VLFRSTVFKTEPFIAMTRELLRTGSAIKEVVVIGDGAGLPAAKGRLAGLAITWLGYVEPKKLDTELRANADLVFGHATALLEAAKLGIPSLLVDGTYDEIKSHQLRSEWLHRCPPGYVGKIAEANDLVGRPVDECLSELTADAAGVATADYHHWRSNHHPEVVADKLADVVRRSTYTYADFLRSRAAVPGGFGTFLEWTKEVVFRRRY